MEFALYSWPISAIVNNFNILTVPFFQRESKIWTSKTKELLIDSLFRGWKIPKIYLNIPENQKEYEIVDGQQRIFTIMDFIQNNFKINWEDEKKYFKDLREEERQYFLNRVLDVEICFNSSDEEIALLYSRLQEGASLNPAEKIHAITGKLSKFIEDMESHPFFEKTKFRKRRYGIKGICQQIFFLKVGGIETAKLPKMKEFFEGYKNFDNDKIKEEIISTLDFMEETFVEERGYLSRAGNIISIFLISSWLQNSKEKISPQKLYRFFNNFYEEFEKKNKTETDYINYNLYLIQSTSGSESIDKRNNVLKKHLCLEEPSLIKNLEDQEIPEFKREIENLFVERIKRLQKLIEDINLRAIGNGKSRIFEFTTQSSSVFTILPRITKNLEEHKKLIEILWKSFYEGSGSGNRVGDLSRDRDGSKLPKDLHILIKIDDLRKVDAHNLELDKETYEKKVKTACEIRKFWTGKKFPQDFDEEDFLIFQHRIIGELLGFAEKLNESLK